MADVYRDDETAQLRARVADQSIVITALKQERSELQEALMAGKRSAWPMFLLTLLLLIMTIGAAVWADGASSKTVAKAVVVASLVSSVLASFIATLARACK